MLTSSDIYLVISMKYAGYINSWKSWEDPWLVFGNSWSQLMPQSHAIGALHLTPSKRKEVANTGYGFNQDKTIFGFSVKQLDQVKAMLDNSELVVDL